MKYALARCEREKELLHEHLHVALNGLTRRIDTPEPPDSRSSGRAVAGHVRQDQAGSSPYSNNSSIVACIQCGFATPEPLMCGRCVVPLLLTLSSCAVYSIAPATSPCPSLTDACQSAGATTLSIALVSARPSIGQPYTNDSAECQGRQKSVSTPSFCLFISLGVVSTQHSSLGCSPHIRCVIQKHFLRHFICDAARVYVV